MESDCVTVLIFLNIFVSFPYFRTVVDRIDLLFRRIIDEGKKDARAEMHMVKYENGAWLWLTSFEVGLVQCDVFAFLVITGHQFAREQSENHRTDHYPSLR